MNSEIEICNLALVGFLGKNSISSFTEGSTEARLCDTLYPIARDKLARASDWSFLRERAALSQVTNDRDDLWTYAYDFPSRAAKLSYLLVEHSGRPIYDYALTADTIYANVPEAIGVYITLEDSNIADWPVTFKEAIALELAASLTLTLTRRSGNRKELLAEARIALGRAIEEDAAQERRTYATGYDPRDPYGSSEPFNLPDGRIVYNEW